MDAMEKAIIKSLGNLGLWWIVGHTNVLRNISGTRLITGWSAVRVREGPPVMLTKSAVISRVTVPFVFFNL